MNAAVSDASPVDSPVLQFCNRPKNATPSPARSESSRKGSVENSPIATPPRRTVLSAENSKRGANPKNPDSDESNEAKNSSFNERVKSLPNKPHDKGIFQSLILEVLACCASGDLQALKAAFGDPPLVSFEHNAELFVDDDGRMPIHHACLNGHLNIVQYLIEELKCDASVRDKSGWTGLQYACKSVHMHIVKYIIDHCGEKS